MKDCFGRSFVAMAVTLVALMPLVAQTPSSSIGREVAVARHLADGQEFSASLTDLLAHGRLLFDANSCAGCHNAPYGIAGGGGDIVANVFVLGQRFDFATFDRSDVLTTRGAVDEGGK